MACGVGWFCSESCGGSAHAVSGLLPREPRSASQPSARALNCGTEHLGIVSMYCVRPWVSCVWRYQKSPKKVIFGVWECSKHFPYKVTESHLAYESFHRKALFSDSEGDLYSAPVFCWRIPPQDSVFSVLVASNNVIMLGWFTAVIILILLSDLHIYLLPTQSGYLGPMLPWQVDLCQPMVCSGPPWARVAEWWPHSM